MKNRSLSNLIGAVILISATLIGGVLVYNFFQKSLNSMENIGQNVNIIASSQLLSSSSQIIYIKITNNMQGDIKIIGIYGIFSNGSETNLSLTSNQIEPDILGKSLSSGNSLSAVLYASSLIESIFMQYNYTITNQIMTSQPVKLS
ncbi:MAG: hypothetical protein ACP5I6_00720 [Caldisphaera sp.]|jgi:hypothetical protein|nr:hypothetical protein [Caldisphaera sp.]PMP61087.1 MAG: hypothetical protein C0201_00870 [Caldisphaera sp.]